MKEETIDLGKWTVPEKWEDITLGQYQEIERLYRPSNENGQNGEDAERKNVDIREIVHILCNKTVDEVNALPYTLMKSILDRLGFLAEPPKAGEASNRIAVGGEEYVVNVMDRLRTGEYVACDTLMKNDSHDYASILAVICRKEGEKYDSDFEANLWEKRRDMFMGVPVTDILPVIAFFLGLWQMSRIPILLCSEISQEAEYIRRSIGSTKGIGAFKGWYLRWRMNRILKSLESIRHTLATS